MRVYSTKNILIFINFQSVHNSLEAKICLASNLKKLSKFDAFRILAIVTAVLAKQVMQNLWNMLVAIGVTSNQLTACVII